MQLLLALTLLFAPEFTLPTRTQHEVTLSELRGKVVYVDFWASWCAPCRESFPWMSRMAVRYGSRGLVIVAVNLDKKRESADAFLDKYAAPFTVAFDPAGKTAEAFHVQAMPSSFLIDRSGKVIYSHEGFEPSKSGKIEQKIQEALSQ